MHTVHKCAVSLAPHIEVAEQGSTRLPELEPGFARYLDTCIKQSGAEGRQEGTRGYTRPFPAPLPFDGTAAVHTGVQAPQALTAGAASSAAPGSPRSGMQARGGGSAGEGSGTRLAIDGPGSVLQEP